MVSSGASGSVMASTKATSSSLARHGEPLGVHLPQLGQALVPQLGVPGVVVAVGAEAHLHVELGHGGDPAAERLEQAHLDPLVVADPAGRLLDVERRPAARAGPTARTALAGFFGSAMNPSFLPAADRVVDGRVSNDHYFRWNGRSSSGATEFPHVPTHWVPPRGPRRCSRSPARQDLRHQHRSEDQSGAGAPGQHRGDSPVDVAEDGGEDRLEQQHQRWRALGGTTRWAPSLEHEGDAVGDDAGERGRQPRRVAGKP